MEALPVGADNGLLTTLSRPLCPEKIIAGLFWAADLVNMVLTRCGFALMNLQLVLLLLCRSTNKG